jgi:hypothetical protein
MYGGLDIFILLLFLKSGILNNSKIMFQKLELFPFPSSEDGNDPVSVILCFLVL